MGLFSKKEVKNKKYSTGLSRTRANFFSKIKDALSGRTRLDDDLFEELTDIFIMADVGVNTTLKFIDELEHDERLKNVNNSENIEELVLTKLKEFYLNNEEISSKLNINENGLSVYLFVGVNGVGKTTTIAKLANRFIKDGKKVLLAAADTFRAGAIDQLEVWANRINCDIYLDHNATDPSSVIYDALTKAINESYDILLCDTAGRLQTKTNLMNELSKMNRVIERVTGSNPTETLLVIDATTGQNGLSQAAHFMETTNITGVVLTKLDGSSKGGIVIGIKDLYNIPIKLVGLGESIDDLEDFDLDDYLNSLVEGL